MSRGFNPRPDMVIVDGSQVSAAAFVASAPEVVVEKAPEFQPTSALIAVTVDSYDGGYVPEMFQQTRLTPRQMVAMKALKCSLHAQNQKLDNGRHVESNGDALRWILERIAEQLPPELLSGQ